MSLEMKLALASVGAVGLLAFVMATAGASQFMVGVVTIPSSLLCLVLFGLGFRAEQKAEQARQAEHKNPKR